MALELYATRDKPHMHVPLKSQGNLGVCVSYLFQGKGCNPNVWTKTRIHSTKQSILSITEYCNVIRSLWLGLDQYQNLRMQCSIAATIHQEFIERERVYDFLIGLNVELDQVRVQILGKEPLPSLNEAFAIVWEERRKI